MATWTSKMKRSKTKPGFHGLIELFRVPGWTTTTKMVRNPTIGGWLWVVVTQSNIWGIMTRAGKCFLIQLVFEGTTSRVLHNAHTCLEHIKCGDWQVLMGYRGAFELQTGMHWSAFVHKQYIYIYISSETWGDMQVANFGYVRQQCGISSAPNDRVWNEVCDWVNRPSLRRIRNAWHPSKATD